MSKNEYPGCPIADIKVGQSNEVYRRSVKLLKLEKKKQILIFKFSQFQNSRLVPSENAQLSDLQQLYEDILNKKNLQKNKEKKKENQKEKKKEDNSEITKIKLEAKINNSKHDSNEEKEEDDTESKERQLNKEAPNPEIPDTKENKKIAKKCLNLVKELRKVRSEIKKNEIEIKKQREKKRFISSVFVTFRKIEDKKIFKNFLPQHGLIRIFFCCKRKQIFLENEEETKKMKMKYNAKTFKRYFTSVLNPRDLSVKEPSDPLNINWEYLDMNKRRKCFKGLIAWSIYFVCMAIGNFLNSNFFLSYFDLCLFQKT